MGAVTTLYCLIVVPPSQTAALIVLLPAANCYHLVASLHRVDALLSLFADAIRDPSRFLKTLRSSVAVLCIWVSRFADRWGLQCSGIVKSPVHFKHL